MKNKYSIGLFVSIFLLIYLSFYCMSDNATKEQADDIQETKVSAVDGYYLQEENGYVVVYLYDKKTIFEYTDILYDDLPELLKKEIKFGKFISSEEELFGFLENYTS